MTNSITETKSRRQRRARRTKVTASATALITLVLLAIAWWTMPRRLQPDEIIREPGVYLSPGSDHRLIVTESDDRTIHVGLEAPGNWKHDLDRFIQRMRGDPFRTDAEFADGRDWFLCFDEFDRLWIFVGRGDRQGRPPQSVSMFGFFFNRNGLLYGALEVRNAEDWKGVPLRFFEQIPAKDDPTAWGEMPPFPAAPPEFSPAERQAAASRRR